MKVRVLYSSCSKMRQFSFETFDKSRQGEGKVNMQFLKCRKIAFPCEGFYILDQSLLGKKLCQKLKLWINASHCNYSLNCLNSAPVHRFECSLPSHCFVRRQWCAPSFLPLKSKPWTKGCWWTVGCKQRQGIKCFAEHQDHRMLMTNTFDVCKKTRQGTEGGKRGGGRGTVSSCRPHHNET